MTQAILFVLFILAGTALLSWPLGRYMTWAMDPAKGQGRPNGFTALFQGVGGSLARQEQDWKRYAVSLLGFNVVMFIVVFSVLALQQYLPLNPDAKEALDPSLIFNTAASFTTNTNLQHYSGEVSFSYLTQLAGLMWLQFVSAAVGLSALTALARGLSGRKLGNFFVDVQRATFLVLLPIAFIVAVLLVLTGVPMTFNGSVVATTLEGVQQTIARGPVAAFVAIKQLGTNGGGFFGPNSAHPLENPTFWSNVVQTVSIIIIPMACVWMFGHIIGRLKHAAALFTVMLILMGARITASVGFESVPTQAFTSLPITQDVGNLEGKELRFGTSAGPLWAVLTTSTSNGSVNAMHDSLNPLTGMMPMIGMWLNEDFGGVGVGMVNMFLYIVVGVFIAGMMIGRTPEYLGWRVESKEVKFAMMALLSHGLFILVGTAIFAATPWGADTLNNVGPHGFSEILYEFSSAAANNGSGFEGLGDATTPWNIATGIVMLLARFIPIILPLAIVGSLSSKRRATESSGTLSVEDGTFAGMLTATVLIVGALTFFPAATLGPIAEHVMFMK
ncbi:potassium-transporting ATPase subunit KdpA (plasmid) [Rhizobium sp. TRM96647]|uniref:potassium-transporting ATPase subunit KdpA n=1 Tax=unclassified Rhizobium TaxID=2613769 RepID=UPI0021E7A8CB|nr:MULTISPECIES: potassium-transporting ATPase subunit KdpA [unclassified Rhizobium]MCV3735215.1 potassium-transporting ATPase subunit KdpA [Rhizobium sp. TRM96647]MCV3758022.1 potassium-transporting ATPase subunit KdpA [Rhizobium sp. TRM96650]